MNSLPLAVGAVIALGVGLLGTGAGFDRDRAYYPVVTIVTASYYALFAVMGASSHALLVESLVGTVFLVAAVLGFKSSLWIVVAALVGHGVYDVLHGAIVTNPGMPRSWPWFCLSFDVTCAAYLAWILKTRKASA